MGKYLIKSIVANDTSEHVAADTGSNYKFKWLDYLVEDLRKAFSNFKTVMEFQKQASTLTNYSKRER